MIDRWTLLMIGRVVVWVGTREVRLCWFATKQMRLDEKEKGTSIHSHWYWSFMLWQNTLEYLLICDYESIWVSLFSFSLHIGLLFSSLARTICNMGIYFSSGVYVHTLIYNSACQCLMLETTGGDRAPRQPGMRGNQIVGLLVTFWGYCFHSS